MSTEVTCYVSLGSNLDNPVEHINHGIKDISQITKLTPLQSSSLYESAPWGYQDQPNFINAVIKIKTSLCPFELLQTLKRIEQQHERKTTHQWGPRTLDCDILLFGNQTLKTQTLTIPHVHMLKRNFVMVPLMEITPYLMLPHGHLIAEYSMHASNLVRLDQHTSHL